MSKDKLTRVPLVSDDDSVWLRWIEQQGEKVEIEFGGFSEGPDELDEETEWLKALTRLLTVSSKKQRIRKLEFDYFRERPSEDCGELIDALCALITALHSQLESLTFSTLTKTLFRCFQNVPTMPKLKELDFGHTNCKGTGQGVHFADLMCKCPNLTRLFLSEFDMSDDDVSAIASVPCSSLEVLDVSNTNLSPHGLKSIAQMLKGCPRLREVYLDHNKPSGDDWSDSCEVLASLSEIPRLELLHCEDTFKDAAQHLQRMVYLKDLSISFAGTDADFESLCSALSGMRLLSSLSLSLHVGLTLEHDRLFTNVLRGLGQLTELRITGSQSSSFSCLGEHVASSDCRLRKFCVSRAAVKDFSPLLSALKHNVSLRSVELSMIKFDEDFVKAVGNALRHNKTLREFTWTGGVTGQQWTTIVEGVRHAQLNTLSLTFLAK